MGARTLMALGVTVAATVVCHGATRTGSVQGDVYLVMQSGDVKRGSGNEVRLVRTSDTLHADMERVCQRYADRLLPVWRRVGSEPDSAVALEHDAREAMRTVLLGATVARAPTGINAHYRFVGVPPGAYVLWAETDIGERHYTWWTPVTVGASGSLTKDLDNSGEADARVYCGAARADVIQKVAAEVQAKELVARQRRDSWLQCYRKAVAITTGYLDDRVAICTARSLRTHADSEWADSVRNPLLP